MPLAVLTPAGSHVRERYYRPELDCMRVCAFLMVWVSHALLSFHGLLPAALLNTLEGMGSCGVPIFFFLSAFLITELLRREKLFTGSVHIRPFYIRRILRIWPLYLGVLVLYGVLGLRFHGFRIEPGRLLASVFLVGNWYIAFHPAITTPMRALWSISVEEQWYLLWPLLARAFAPRVLLAACAAVIVSSYLLLAGLAHSAVQSELHVTAWVNSGVQFQFLAMGAGAAILLRGRVPVLFWGVRGGFALVGVTMLAAASGLCRFKTAAVHSITSLCGGYFLVALGTAALFFAVFGIAEQAYPSMLKRWGQLSFGLYVFHETGFFIADALARHIGLPPGLAAVTAEKVCALILTCGMAYASYYCWERPFLRWKERWTMVRSREAA